MMRVPQEQYGGLRKVFQKTFMLLRAMARGNRVVQGRLFDRLDMLLSKEGAAAELAECLTEVSTWTGCLTEVNTWTCWVSH